MGRSRWEIWKSVFPANSPILNVKFLGGAVNDVFVKARLGAASFMRLTETYESATVLGQTVDLPQAVILYYHLYCIIYLMPSSLNRVVRSVPPLHVILKKLSCTILFASCHHLETILFLMT